MDSVNRSVSNKILLFFLLGSMILNCLAASKLAWVTHKLNQYREECGDRTDAPTPDVTQP